MPFRSSACRAAGLRETRGAGVVCRRVRGDTALALVLWDMAEFKLHGLKQGILVPRGGGELMIFCMFHLLISKMFIAINVFRDFHWHFL